MELVPVDGHVMDLMTLKEHAQRIEEDLFNSGVMSQISISAAIPIRRFLWKSRKRNFLRYNITFDEIVRAIQNNNQDVSGGEIKSEEEEFLIRLRSRSAKPDKIGNIILRGQTEGGYITYP